MGKLEITKPSFNHYKIHTEIIIDVSPEKVWKVLTDSERQKEWSNSIFISEGDIKDDSNIIVYIKPMANIKFTQKIQAQNICERRRMFWPE